MVGVMTSPARIALIHQFTQSTQEVGDAMGLIFRSDCRREGHTEDAVLDVGSSSLGPGDGALFMARRYHCRYGELRRRIRPRGTRSTRLAHWLDGGRRGHSRLCTL